MKKVTFYFGIIMIVFWMFVCGGNVAYSEDLTFPTTRAGILEILETEPPAELRGTGALPSAGDGSALFTGQQKTSGTSRGLAGIVSYEYEKLVEAPKVGVLVLFDYNSADIKADSNQLLRLYGDLLQTDLSDAVLLVAGHTDNIGSDQYNLMLSKRRAESVRNFLISEFQIEETRLLISPYGEGQPLETNATPAGRAKNRRVEFIRIE